MVMTGPNISSHKVLNLGFAILVLVFSAVKDSKLYYHYLHEFVIFGIMNLYFLSTKFIFDQNVLLLIDFVKLYFLALKIFWVS